MRLDFMSQNTPNRVRFEWGDFPHGIIKKNIFESRDPKQDEDFLSFLTNYFIYGGFPNDSHEECPL